MCSHERKHGAPVRMISALVLSLPEKQVPLERVALPARLGEESRAWELPRSGVLWLHFLLASRQEAWADKETSRGQG